MIYARAGMTAVIDMTPVVSGWLGRGKSRANLQMVALQKALFLSNLAT